ncbi:MAG: hypothetical protein IT360_15105 [Gemmatimonadaceae bacterium]|nr:hypothetical protein [Gemmatimonadaceae bacterium]
MLRVRPDLALLAAVVLVLAPRPVAPVSAAAASSSPRSNQPPRWTAPRRDAGITLRPLWRSDTQRDAATLTYPFDLVFAAQGLAIYDHGEKHVQVVDAATGRARFAVGRHGPGPGEFGDRAVTFFGPAARPLMVEAIDGRVTALEGEKLIPMRVPREQRWSTGCQWGRDRLLLQVRGLGEHDSYVVTTGDGARTVDSLPAPWPRHRTLPFLVRQAPLKQLDDSTCVYLPVYQQEFAIISPTAPPVTGTHIESLPEAREAVSGTSKRRRHSLAEGTRAGASDVAAWRDVVLVSFLGTSAQRHRVLDVYDRRSLAYRGSVLLPYKIDMIAVHGDTLAVTGEVEDEPVVGVFLLGRRGGAASAR